MRNPNGLLSQKSLFDKYLNIKSHSLSPYHFSSIFLWQDFFDFEFELIEDNLCVYAHQQGSSFLYLPPLSRTWQPSVIEHCFLKMNKINPRTARIENIEQEHVKFIDDKFKTYPKLQEYVYQKDDLIELKGQTYKSQRHDIHHFQAHHQGVFRPYEEKDFKACLDLYERWAQDRYDKHEEDIYRCMLQENKIVHELALIFYKELGLWGYVVDIGEKISAYSFGYLLNSQTFCVLLEIADVNAKGLGAFIFNRVCSHESLRPYQLINTMDDFGVPYVAASKQAYHPKLKPVSYTVTLKDPL